MVNEEISARENRGRHPSEVPPPKNELDFRRKRKLIDLESQWLGSALSTGEIVAAIRGAWRDLLATKTWTYKRSFQRDGIPREEIADLMEWHRKHGPDRFRLLAEDRAVLDRALERAEAALNNPAAPKT